MHLPSSYCDSFSDCLDVTSNNEGLEAVSVVISQMPVSILSKKPKI